MPGRARREQHRGRRGGLADADRLHVGLDVLHRVVDREQPGDLAAGRVDVHRDVLVGVFATRGSAAARSNRFATVSSIGVPRKMMRSLSSREYGSQSMRPAACPDRTRHRDVLVAAGRASVSVGGRVGSSWGSLVRRALVRSVGGLSTSVASPSGRVRSTAAPSSSTTVAWSTRNSQCLAASDVRAYRLQQRPSVRDRVGPCPASRRYARRGARPRRRARRRCSRCSPGRRPPAAPDRRARRRPSLPGRRRRRLCGSWPVAARYSVDRRALMLQAVDEVVERDARSPGRRARRGPRRRTSPAAASSTLSRTAICAWTSADQSRAGCGCRRAARRRCRTRSTSEAQSSVSSGSTLCFVSFTSTWNATSWPARSPKRSGRASLNSRIAPDACPRSSSSSSGTTLPEPTR